MAKTRYMHLKMNQRGITERMKQIVQDYGICFGDKLVLDRTNIDLLMNGIDRLRKDLLKVRDKGGLVVVEKNSSDMTAYA